MLTGPPIDWNSNGVMEMDIARNINCDLRDGSFNNEACAGAAPQSTFCAELNWNGDDTCDPLTGYNDWPAINFTGISDADRGEAEVVTCPPPY